MDAKTFENWEQKREQVKKEFPHLTIDDLIYQVGQEEELLLRLQEKTKKNKEEIRKWLTLMG